MRNFISNNLSIEKYYQVKTMEAIQQVSQVRSRPKFISFDQKGNTLAVNKHDAKLIAKQVDNHYKQWNKVKFKELTSGTGLGIGALIAIFEAVTAVTLGILEKSPATFTNAATTFSECVQVLIAGNSNDENHEVGENLMAGVIATAGAGGLYQWSKDMINLVKGEEEDLYSLPIVPKVSLSLASFASSVMMFSGWGEKIALAPLAKKTNGGMKAKEMRLNGSSDMRCSFEWLMMTLFPWVKQFKPFKILIDLVLPLAALQDGVGHFVEKVIDKDKSNVPKYSFKYFVRKLFGISNTKEGEISIPNFFFKGWYFGNKQNEGFRARFLLPAYRYFGCEEPPICYLTNDAKLAVKVPEANVPHQNNSQNVREDNNKTPTDLESNHKTIQVKGQGRLKDSPASLSVSSKV